MADGTDIERPSAEPRGFAAVRVNVGLFLTTVVTVFLAGASYASAGVLGDEGFLSELAKLLEPSVLLTGWTFAVPLLSILLAHEFGHYFAARYHRVPASLPYFIPLPVLSLFGTLGAVIAMRGTIRSRNALLDIGAAGPLAGMVVAVPVLCWGLSLSPVMPLPEGPSALEGQSLFYSLLKWLVLGPIPEGHDVFLHPAAFAGWAGLFVTMLNLLPFGQLDGGHIAYALFDVKQNRFAPWMRRALLGLFVINLARFLAPILLGESSLPVSVAISNSLFWLVWYAVLGILVRVGGVDHPPVEPGTLSPGRKLVAWFSLALFVVLFMPTPYAIVG